MREIFPLVNFHKDTQNFQIFSFSIIAPITPPYCIVSIFLSQNISNNIFFPFKHADKCKNCIVSFSTI